MDTKRIDELSYAVCEFIAHLDAACMNRVKDWIPINRGLELQIEQNEYVQVHPVNWPSGSAISCRVLPWAFGKRVEDGRIMANHLSFSVSVKVDWKTEPPYYAILVWETEELLSEACSEIQQKLMAEAEV